MRYINAIILIAAGYFFIKRVRKYRKIKKEESKKLLRIFDIYENDSWGEEYRKTRRALASFLKNYPASARGWALYGKVYQAEGDMTEAEKGYQKSYELDRDKNIAALIGLGDVERKKGNFEDA